MSLPTIRPISDFEVPFDFPLNPYITVYNKVTSRYVASDARTEFSAAWIALAYRFTAITELDNKFTQSIHRAGDAPVQPERFIQDQALFDFFVNGLAAIESLCYGSFALGNLLAPVGFPFTTEREKRSVTPEATRDAFIRTFPGSLTNSLRVLCSSTEYDQWRSARNLLAHRIAPGRHTFAGVGSDAPNPASIMMTLQIPLDLNTTSVRRSWLTTTVLALLTAVNDLPM